MDRPRRGTAHLAVACLATLSAGAAAAEDATDWSGWYVGATLNSYATTLSETEVTLPGGAFSAAYDYTGDGLGFGLHVGRAWQREALTYGFELGASTGERVAAEINSPGFEYFYDTSLIFSLKGRVGYAVLPRTQVFAVAGLSAGNLDFDWTQNGIRETGQVWTTGYVVGLGVEQRLGARDAIRFGLDYTRRDSGDFSAPGILPGLGYSNELEQVTISIGFTHYFGD